MDSNDASTKTEYQQNQRKHQPELYFILESIGSCIGGKVSGNRTQIHDSDTQWRDKKEIRSLLNQFLMKNKAQIIYNTITTISRKSTATSIWSRKRT